jgi:6-phosphogluconolactonase (cycloisomerase 2 family)
MKELLCAKRRWSLAGSSSGLRSLVFLIVAACALHAQVNAVYVNGNIGTVSNGNVVYGYKNDGSGHLTPLPGSPYSTGGTGSAPTLGMPLGLQTDDDQQVIINDAGTLLFTVNGFSNTIAVFDINSDGSLTMIPGSPSTSGGSQPASLGLFDGALGNGIGFLVAANKSSDPTQINPKKPNFQTFTVATNGTLTHNANAQVSMTTGASPSQVAIGLQHLVFGMQFAGGSPPPPIPSTIYSYRIRSDGTLKFNNSVTTPVAGSLFLGEVVHPTKAIFYVGLPADSQIGVYTYAPSTGLISFQTTVPNPGELACWLAINSAGTRLYSGESMSNSITVYDLTNALLPVQLQHITLTTTVVGSSVTNMRFDPTGQFLYAISNETVESTLHVFNVAADGTLSESITPMAIPVPFGNYPIGLATVMK